jgi:hypothetical protein
MASWREFRREMEKELVLNKNIFSEAPGVGQEYLKLVRSKKAIFDSWRAGRR